jgi:hypothetical protein
MTTATIWDEALGQDRPLTEEEVRKLQQDAFYNDEITVAEQQAAQAAFKLNIDAYINIRGRIDPEWRNVPDTSGEDDDWDFLGDTISVEWKEYDRCGDRDYFRRDFPLEHLWHPDWESLLTGERDQRVQAEKEAREAEEAKRKAAKEVAERKQLADLLAKYGVPPEYQTRVLGHG